MSETIILECKQSNSKVTKNGDYETTLNRPITIEEGDEVLVKNCFIDTVASSSGNIIVAEDTNITFSLGMYIIDTEVVPQRTYKNGNNNNHPDGQRYVLCKKSATTGPGVSGNEVFVNFAECIGNSYQPNVKLEYEYKDLQGNLYSGTTFQTIQEAGASEAFFINIACLEDSMKVTNTAELADRGVKFQKFDSTDHAGTTETYHIETFDGNFTIEKGEYDPSELARRISQKFTQVPSVTATIAKPVDSPFLKSTSGFTASSDYAFVAPSGDDIITVTSADLYVGTNQAEVKFDEETKRFMLNSIDMPLYDANSGDMTVAFLKKGTDPQYNWVSSSMGVFFKKIGPDSFWEDLLGFQTSDFLVSSIPHNPQLYNDGDGGAIAALIPQPNFVPGTNVTEQFIGITDAVATKDKLATTSFTLPRVSTTTLISTSGQTFTPIVAVNSVNNLETGYFLIDVDSKFSQQLVSSDYYSQSVQAIVSRFYTKGNYTSAGTEASIPYVHRGTNQMLTSLRVRILDPLTYDAPTVGENNTVFIQITKNPKSTQLY